MDVNRLIVHVHHYLLMIVGCHNLYDIDAHLVRCMVCIHGIPVSMCRRNVLADDGSANIFFIGAINADCN